MLYKTWIRLLQFASICLMWAFAASLLVLVPWLVIVAARWHDALNWSLGISLVMLPVYLAVASTLTYVWIGVMRGAKDKSGDEPALKT